MAPTVTVIMVTFNAANHLKVAIESFLSQTFESKELVIVDGASTDNTVDIITQYTSPNIRYVSEPDNGIYEAMNKGVGMAKGEWLYFLGSDDYFMNSESLASVFKRELNGIDIAYGDVYSELLRREYDGPTSKEKLLFSNLCHQSIFYRKGVFDVAGFYNPLFTLFADWEFNIRSFIHHDLKTAYIPVVIAYFSAAGKSTANKDLNFLRKFLFPENLKYLDQSGISKLNDIIFYDRWWRLLRSLRLAGAVESLHELAYPNSIPKKIEKMFRFQRRFPEKILFNGVFSKMMMTISYLVNR